MPDLPDWYKYLGDSNRYALGDMGELAARLGSPSVFERLGEVVWFDDMSHGLATWQTSYSGTGGAVKVVSYPTLQSSYAIQMIGGSDGDAWAILQRYFAPIELSKIGVEVAVAFCADFSYFDLTMDFERGTYYIDARIRIDYANSALKVYTSAGYQTFAALDDFGYWDGNFHNIKLVADLDGLVYKRMWLNDVVYNLTEYTLNKADYDTENYTLMTLKLASRAGNNDHCNIGRVVITANEP